jgi:hypothetical protein
MFGPSITGLPHHGGLAGLHGLHRLNRLRRLNRHHLDRRMAPVIDFAAGIGRRRGWTRSRRGPEPSLLWLLLAGLAVVGFARVVTAIGSRRRSTGEKIVLGALLLLLGAVVLPFRRSAARYR